MEHEITPRTKALPPGKHIAIYRNGTKAGYFGLEAVEDKYGTQWFGTLIPLGSKDQLPIWYIEPDNDDWNYLMISPEGYPGKLGWYNNGEIFWVGLREAASWGYWRFHPGDDSSRKPARLVYNTHDGAYGYMIYWNFSDPDYFACYLDGGEGAKGEAIYFGVEDP